MSKICKKVDFNQFQLHMHSKAGRNKKMCTCVCLCLIACVLSTFQHWLNVMSNFDAPFSGMMKRAVKWTSTDIDERQP